MAVEKVAMTRDLLRVAHLERRFHMDRRDMIRAAGSAFAGAIAAAVAPACDGGSQAPLDYVDLDRLPDTTGVTALATTVAEMVRHRPRSDSDADYGAAMRILSKSLGVLCEEHRTGRPVPLKEPSGGVATAIAAVLKEVHGSSLGHDERVRALVHATGTLSEEHRVHENEK